MAVLTLKANHPTLYRQAKDWFDQAQAQQFLGIDVSYDKRIEKGHHRTEIREVWSVPASALVQEQAQRRGEGGRGDGILWRGLKLRLNSSD